VFKKLAYLVNETCLVRIFTAHNRAVTDMIVN